MSTNQPSLAELLPTIDPATLTDEKSRAALAVADQIAAGLSEFDVARAKQRAETRLATH